MKGASARLLAAAALVVGLVVVGAGPAEAAGCVTRPEYNRVTEGMTVTQVHPVFGTSGSPYPRRPGVREGALLAGSAVSQPPCS